MAKRNAEHINLGKALNEFIKHNNLSSGIDQVNVKDAWYAVMGPNIGNYTTDVQFKNETLYVQLNSSVLREELSYGIEKIIKNLNDELQHAYVKKLVLR